MRTDSTPAEPPLHRSLVTVETNRGGHLLLEAVRDALAHLPVRVEPVTRTAPIEGAPRV